jgi:site-specific recombinase XerD
VGFSRDNSPFLNEVRRVIRVKRLSLSTERSYLHYIIDYICFHRKRHPEALGEAEVQAYLSHLALEKQVAASTQNVALSALLFLYTQVLGRELGTIDAVRAKRPKRLPTVFSHDEVERILDSCLAAIQPRV